MTMDATTDFKSVMNSGTETEERKVTTTEKTPKVVPKKRVESKGKGRKPVTERKVNPTRKFKGKPRKNEQADTLPANVYDPVTGDFPEGAMLYFDIVFEEYNAEEDGKSFGEDDIDMELNAARNMGKMLGKKVDNEGHGSDDALVCKVYVESYADLKSAWENLSFIGDDEVDTGVEYFVARGFTLSFDPGQNEYTWGEYGQSRGSIDDFLEDYAPTGRSQESRRKRTRKPRKNEDVEGITVSPEGPLEERVYAEAADSGYDTPEGWLEDLCTHGAQSGMWMEIVTYAEAPAFYHKYQNEIDGMLKELCSDTGSTPGELFARAGWDEEDFFAREDLNQTLLASFGVEEAARHMLERAGWEG